MGRYGIRELPWLARKHVTPSLLRKLQNKILNRGREGGIGLDCAVFYVPSNTV